MLGTLHACLVLYYVDALLVLDLACRRSKLRWSLVTHFIRIGFFVTTGSNVGFNQWSV